MINRLINRNYDGYKEIYIYICIYIYIYICVSVCVCVYSLLVTFTKSLNIVEGQDTCFLTIPDTD